MSATPAAAAPSAQQDLFKIGQLVWVRFSKKGPWPSRIASETEVNDYIKSEKKNSQEFLVYFFGSRNYSWVRPNQITAWDFDASTLGESKKKNKAKSYAQGLDEAQEWFNGPKILPVASTEPDAATSKSDYRKRRSTEGDADAPAAKRSHRKILGEGETSSESDEDAPYKIPYPDAKKAKRVRVMRKLGLYPPEGSLFKAATHS
jgi:hypothetical protein